MKIKAASGFVIAVVLVSMIWAVSPAQACPFNEASTTGCKEDAPAANAQINGGGVDVSATGVNPGRGAGSGRSNSGGTGTELPPVTPRPSTLLPGGQPEVPGVSAGRDGFTVTSPVTLADLVNFKPAPGVGHMEPNGWMIVGLDTNFYATAQSQVQTGELLGQQASVRFTPARYHWSYGDGKSANLGTRGSTWAALGIREFDRTPTSHVYARAGSYDVDLTIDFAAEYRYAGGDWIPIAGTLPIPANTLHATAGDAKTVLVEHDCGTLPRGPGC